MRLSTLGRLATGTAGLLFVTAAVAEAYGQSLLRLILLIAAGVLFAPVAVHLMLFLPAKPSRPAPPALPAVARPALPPSTAAGRPAARSTGPAHRALPADRRPSPRPRANQAALTR